MAQLIGSRSLETTAGRAQSAASVFWRKAKSRGERIAMSD